MHPAPIRSRRPFWNSRLLLSAAMTVASWPALAAFDPAAEATSSALPISTTRTRLPDTGVLTGGPRPLYAPDAAVPSASTYATPLQPLAMPKPLYPQRSAMPIATAAAAPVAQPSTIAPVAPIAPLSQQPAAAQNLPPVDPTVAARAQQEMAQLPNSPTAPTAIRTPVMGAAAAPQPSSAMPAAAPATTSFIAPAPVFAAAPMQPAVPVAPVTAPALAAQPQQKPIVIADPIPSPAPAPAVVAQQAHVVRVPAPTSPGPLMTAQRPALPEAQAPTELSSQSRAILSKIPSRIDTPPAGKTQRVGLARVSPQIQDVLGKDAQEDAYNAVGLSIKVRRPGLDTDYELNRAYSALMGGDSAQAIEIYKNILSVEPRNQDALFGLAATYHRQGQTDQARPFYGMLLQLNPNHREALNNFLTLVSEESPQDALPELERLELRNPDFSPIPAQIAIVLDKVNYPDRAEDKMLRAIELAPENLTYKYNLAIMLDRHHRYADAGALYRYLIAASLKGETVPASLDALQKRLNYITTAVVATHAGS